MITDEISDDNKDVKVIKGLLDAYFSTHDTYNGNQYVWNIFNSFINHKHKMTIDIYYLVNCCKGLLDFFFSDVLRLGYGEEYCVDKYKNKNLLKRQIVSTFKNGHRNFLISSNHYVIFRSLVRS